MRLIQRVVICLLLLSFTSGCATFRGTLLSSMAAGGVAGFAIGYPLAPAGTAPAGEGALFAATGAAVGALAATLLYNPDKKISDLEDRNKKLEIEVKKFKDETSPKSLFESYMKPFASLPKGVRDMIESGALEANALNQWDRVGENDNHLIHKDLEVILTPPRLNPRNFNTEDFKGAFNGK